MAHRSSHQRHGAIRGNIHVAGHPDRVVRKALGDADKTAIERGTTTGHQLEMPNK